jgi:hypothetical protein
VQAVGERETALNESPRFLAFITRLQLTLE